MWSTCVVWVRGVASRPPLLRAVLTPCACSKDLITGRERQFCSAVEKEHEVHSQLDTERQLCSADEKEQEVHTQVNLQAITSKIHSGLHSKGITRYSEKTVSSLCQLLSDLGIKAQTIEDQLLEMPDLLGYSIKSWTNVCEVMVENGLPSLKILQNIALNTKLLQMKPARLQQTLLQYREMMVGKQNVLSLVNKDPTLYLVEPAKVKRRLNNLASMFPPSDLKSLLTNNPNVITDSWENIMSKIMYIHEEMGLEQPHIAGCKVLRHSLLHIKTRHQFLQRAGLYKKPNLLRDKQSYKRNRPLSEIMDTSNKYFSNRVARLSEQEYAVFKFMMEAEELGDDWMNFDEDSEEEEDPKLSYKKHK